MTRATIIYDEQCGFCLRSLDWVRARDRDQRFDAIGCRRQASLGQYPGLDEAACLREMYLIDSDGRRLAGGDAAAAVLRHLPGYRLLGAVLGAPVLRHLTRAGYRLVARHRSRLAGVGAGCKLESP